MQEQKQCIDCYKKISKWGIRCLNCAKKGKLNPQYNKKRKRIRKNDQGYIQIYIPEHPNKSKQGYVFEHRIVMEKNIKRFLKKTEHVHHINGVKDDNRVENLIILSSNKHHKIHSKEINRDKYGKFTK